MAPKRYVDEEHMLIHRENSEERGGAASPRASGTVDEAQSEQQMVLIAWKWKSKTKLIITSLGASHSTPTLFYPVLLV